MKVNWNDLYRPESPGSFSFRGGTITIRQEEIDVWRCGPTLSSRSGAFAFGPTNLCMPSLAGTSCRTRDG